MERDIDSSMLRAEVSAIGLRYEAAKLKTTRSSPRPRGMVHRETLGAGAAIGKKASSVSRSGIWITPSEVGHLIRSHDACLVCTVHFANTGRRNSFSI